MIKRSACNLKNIFLKILESLKFVERRRNIYIPKAFKVTQYCDSCKKTFFNVSLMKHSFNWFFLVKSWPVKKLVLPLYSFSNHHEWMSFSNFFLSLNQTCNRFRNKHSQNCNFFKINIQILIINGLLSTTIWAMIWCYVTVRSSCRKHIAFQKTTCFLT